MEGNGRIAFTRHTAILENAGKNPSFWSRNVIPDDFELLCRNHFLFLRRQNKVDLMIIVLFEVMDINEKTIVSVFVSMSFKSH